MRKKIRLKKPAKIIIGIFISILVILLLIFGGYFFLESKLKKIGYSKQASYVIIRKFKIRYAENYPNNKTLNAAFESRDYQENNLEHYSKITYQNHKNIIRNINLLLKKGYSDREISIILKHGNDNDVYEFSKRGRIKYLEEFFSYDFAKLANYDRYIKYMDENGDDEETTIIKVNLDLDKEDYTDFKKVDDYSKFVLANKHYYLGNKYVPEKLIKVPGEYLKNDSEGVKGVNEAVSAAIVMMKAAKKEGLSLFINSGYRSYKEQEEVYDTYLKLYGDNYVANYVSKPGFSEHQTGYAFDFASGNSKVFIESEEYKWMVKNSYKYGFIYRFLKSKEELTGVKHEAWHFRYVGKEAAKVIDTEELSFEEYYVKYLDK